MKMNRQNNIGWDDSDQDNNDKYSRADENKHLDEGFFSKKLATRPKYIYMDYYSNCCKNIQIFSFRVIYKCFRLFYTSILFYFLPMISLYTPFWISYLTGNQLTQHRIDYCPLSELEDEKFQANTFGCMESLIRELNNNVNQISDSLPK